MSKQNFSQFHFIVKFFDQSDVHPGKQKKLQNTLRKTAQSGEKKTF